VQQRCGSGCVNALKKGRHGQCYIAGNENLEYKEFLKKHLKK
jgi:hypothetical protein